MMSSYDPDAHQSSSASSDPEMLREEIERTRTALGETVEAVASRSDMRTRTKAQAERLTKDAKDRLNEAREMAQSRYHDLSMRAKQHGADDMKIDKRGMAIIGASVLAVTIIAIAVRCRKRRLNNDVSHDATPGLMYTRHLKRMFHQAHDPECGEE